jgi:polysaccharide biosynthesis protein PslG
MRNGIRCTLIAGLLGLAVAGSAQDASAAFRVGIQDDDAFITAPAAERAQAFNRARSIGAGWLRINMVWQGYQDLGFGPYDRAVNEARARGMRVQITITGNPVYVNGGRGYIARRPNIARYANWAGRVARHFRGRVYAYSIWNEPNLGMFFLPQGKPGQVHYGKLYRAAYKKVKRADRRAKILIGETSPSNKPLRFLAGAAKGGALRADGWAHHPYQFVRVLPGRRERRYTGISNTAMMKRGLKDLARRKLLRTPSGKPAKLYFTEFGYPRQGSLFGIFSEGMRADYSVRSMRIARRAGAEVMVWYQVFNPARDTQRTLWDTGLVGRDGTESLVYQRLRAARASIARR